MRISRSSSLLALLFVGLLAVPAGAAQTAAPTYVSSEPGNGEKLHQAPDRVKVTFNEPLDESSQLTVKDSCGRTVDDGNVEVDANTMTVGIELKPSGHYMVSYVAKGLGGLTGQNDGEFHFEVHAGTACGKNGGGGHGDHDDDKKRHGRHGGDRDQDRRHGTHGGGSGNDDHSSTNHGSGGGSDHSGTGHTGSGGSGHENMGRSGAGNDRHGKKHAKKQHGKKQHGKGHGGGHGDGHDFGQDPDGRTQAAGPAAPFGTPNGTAVLTALGLSLALGVVGGWFLRISGGR